MKAALILLALFLAIGAAIKSGLLAAIGVLAFGAFLASFLSRD